MLGSTGNAPVSHKLSTKCLKEKIHFTALVHCHLNIQENQLQELKSTIDNLTQEVTALKTVVSPPNEVISPQGSSPQPQSDIQSTPAVSNHH